MEAHAFRRFLELAVALSQRQRIDLADALSRGLRQQRTVALVAAAGLARACPRCRSHY